MQPLQWHDASPSPHLILDDFAPSPMIRAAAKTWPGRCWEWWHKYDNETALKLATMGRAPFPPAAQLLLDQMAMLDVSKLCPDAFPDLSFHAGGMHTLPPGGFLGLHKDSEIHPLTGWSSTRSCSSRATGICTLVGMVATGWIQCLGGWYCSRLVRRGTESTRVAGPESRWRFIGGATVKKRTVRRGRFLNDWVRS